jgi:hypothetical protein
VAKSKLSVTLNLETIEKARALVTVSSVSELLDVALERLIRTEEEAQHVAGYVRTPADADFITFAQTSRDAILDDVDWAALYNEPR